MLTLTLTLKQSRKLDVYFEYEEKIMSKSTLDKSLLDMISDPDGEYFKSELGIKFVKVHHKSVPAGTSGLVKSLCATCAKLVKKKLLLIIGAV